MQRSGQLLRVNAELGSTETVAQLRSDSYDQPIADLAGRQEQIVVPMRRAPNGSLTEIAAERSLRQRPTNPNAFDLFLRARAIWRPPQTNDTTSQTVRLYEEALERDANSLLALTGAIEALLSEYLPDGLSYDAAMDKDAISRLLDPCHHADHEHRAKRVKISRHPPP